ncbi:MAG: tetratricopeptide repeat protein [Acidobacteriota bacterium]|nr:tetratricopeptide repeat protein [Acidobacteriota bacterium]
MVGLLHDLPGVKVERNVFLPPVKDVDPDDCEIDVLLTTETASGHQVQFAVECKNERGPVGIGKIREFLDKLDDVGIPPQLGVFVSASGFTRSAIRRAKSKGLKLFTLTGLSANRLSSAVAEAFQFNVYLIAQITDLTLTNEASKVTSEQGLAFFDAAGNPCGSVLDLIWNRWRQGDPPSVIGERRVDLQVPKGWHQIIDGRPEPAISLSATMRVTGLVVTLAGKSKRHTLLNPVDGKVERGRLNVTFEIPRKAQKPTHSVVEVRSEEELNSLVGKRGAVRITSRVRLPRIRLADAFNYPPSRRDEELLVEQAKKYKAGEVSNPFPPAVAELENEGESLDVLGLMHAKEYARVISLRRQFERRPTPEFADLLSWAYLMQSNVLIEKAGSKRGRESERLIERAVGLIKEALSINPVMPEAFNNLGLALSKLGRHEEALASFDRVGQLEPDHPYVWGNRAEVLYLLKRYDEAVESCEKALSLNADDGRAFYNRGHALSALGRFDEAIRNFDDALRIKPENADAWDEHGDALMYAGEPGRALESYENALKSRPDHFYALSGRGDALQHLSRFEDAVASYDSALAVRPASGPTWVRRGQALLHLKRFNEAVASYDRALAADPDDYGTHAQRAFALTQANELDRALESTSTALSLAPTDAERYYPLKIRSIIHHLKLMHEEAVDDLLSAWRLNPDELMGDQVAHGLIAAVYTASPKSPDSILLLAEMEWNVAALHASAGEESEARRIAENATGALESLVVDDGSRKLEIGGFNLSGVVVTGALVRGSRRLVDCGDRDLAREHIKRMNAWVRGIYGDSLTPLDDCLAQLEAGRPTGRRSAGRHKAA